MCTQDFEYLENRSISYICYKCNAPNYISNLHHRYEVDTINRFDQLSNINDDSLFPINDTNRVFIPKYHSSPKGIPKARIPANITTTDPTEQNEMLTDTENENYNSLEGNAQKSDEIPNKNKDWRTIVVNANSIRSKQAELEMLIHDLKPDAIIMTETKLGSEHDTSEFLPKQLGYKVHRNDKKSGCGGVLIAVKECYSQNEVYNDNTGVVEWVEVNLKDRKKMYIGAFYRQPDRFDNELVKLEASLNKLMEISKNNSNPTITIGGDFNAGNINWDENLVESYTTKRFIHEELLRILDFFHLTQHQQEPTRLGRLLDLYCTNKPAIVQNMYTAAGISDHDIPIADCNVKPSLNKKVPRKIYNYKKADWENIKQKSSTFREQFLKEYMDRAVEHNWKKFKKHINTVMDKFIPSKTTSTRHNLPWINTKLKRMIKKKQRLYNKAKKSKKNKEWENYNTHKKETGKALRSARWNYINKILLIGLNENNTKPFWKYIKSTKQENIGVAPLQKDGETKTDSIDKAEILNDQFKSVFTKDKENYSPKMEDPEYPTIDTLSIHIKGVEKLLQKLKVNKASGPDDLPAYILRETATEIAPLLTAIFNQSLKSGTLPEDWLKANIAPIFKKGNKNLAENYRPVSLTCICCKVMEHIICKHILTHVD